MLHRRIGLIVVLIFSLAALGCGLAAPAQKPEPPTGPAGKGSDTKHILPLIEQLKAPPAQLYDLEQTAGSLFEGLNKGNWPQAEAALTALQHLWSQARPQVEGKKGIADADKAMVQLAEAVAGKKSIAAYENLNKFIGGINTIGKSYKLSPLADLLLISNAVRDASFYIEDRNWLKASAKARQLDDTWKEAKPVLEQAGILGEVIRTHLNIAKLRDAVAAENKAACDEILQEINLGLATIRDFYRGQ